MALQLSSDALLGLLAHSALAVGLVVLAFMTWVRVDLMGFLFGDVLAITHSDLAVIWAGGLVVLTVLALIWRSLFAATVSRELAMAESRKPEQVNFIFMILMASVIAVAMKIVGVLLITAMLMITKSIGPPPVYLTRTDGGLCHDHRRGGCLVWVARVSGIRYAGGAKHCGCCLVLLHPVFCQFQSVPPLKQARIAGFVLSCQVANAVPVLTADDRSHIVSDRSSTDPHQEGWLSHFGASYRDHADLHSPEKFFLIFVFRILTGR